MYYFLLTAGKWNVTSPLYLNLGTKPVKCLFPLENHLLCTSGNVIHFVNLATLEVQVCSFMVYQLNIYEILNLRIVSSCWKLVG